MELPKPKCDGGVSLAETLSRRRSCRQFKDQPLTSGQISQILWAGQGITLSSRGFRTAPSAGATFPLDLYAVISDGVFRYDADLHQLSQMMSGDVRRALADACLGQRWMRPAGLIVAITATFERTTGHYGPRGERYVWMEVGHAAENMFLQAEALGLGSVAVGACDDAAVADVLGLPKRQRPALLVAIGAKSQPAQ